MADGMINNKTWIHIILIFFLGLAIYAGSLNGRFIWDDKSLVEDNLYIREWSGIRGFFSGEVTTHHSLFPKYYRIYRPLQLVTYAADYSLWKLNASGYHLTNILLHISVALLAYWLFGILYNNSFLSLLAGIFFVVHPINTEAVSYIAGRSDSLCGIFMLSSLILYIKAQDIGRAGLYIFALLLYIGALLSRETSLVLPVLLLLYHYSFKKKIDLRAFLFFLLITLGYVFLRPSFYIADPFSAAFLRRIPGFFVAVTDYIRLLFLPLDLHMEYGDRLFAITEPRAVMGFFIVVSLVAYAWIKRKTDRLIFFSISWFFILLLPERAGLVMR